MDFINSAINRLSPSKELVEDSKAEESRKNANEINKPPDENWRKEARKTLWNLKETFCPADYDEYFISNIPQLDERELLTTKLCFLLYGQPIEDNSSLESEYELKLDSEYEELIRESSAFRTPDILSLYKPFQRKKAKEVTKAILSLERKTPDRLHAAIIFVCFRLYDSKIENKALPIPVIRILRNPFEDETEVDDECWFVDLEGRVYKNWETYLSDNKLPRGEICYPLIGVYSTRPIENHEDESASLLIGHQKTPACGLVRRFLSVADTTMTVATFGALAVAAAGLAITVAPMVAVAGTTVGAAGMIYGGSRSVQTLVDRGMHKQTLAPNDAESRGAWIGLAGSALAVGSIQATQALANAAASSADGIGRTLHYTADIMNSTALGFGTVGILNQSYGIFKGYQEEQTISKFDLLQLSLSALLLTHSLINFTTAKTIIHDAKAETLSKFEHQLDIKKPRTGFDHVKSTLSHVKPKAFKRRSIRSVRQIDDPREFYKKIYDISNRNNGNGENANTKSIILGENGKLIIGGKEFKSETLVNLNHAEQAALLSYLNSLSKGDVTENTVAEKLEKWCENYTKKDERLQKIFDEIPEFKGKNNSKILMEIKNSYLPIISSILPDFNDSEDIKNILIIALKSFHVSGFQSTLSFLQIIVIIRNFAFQTANNSNGKKDGSEILNNLLEIDSNLIKQLFDTIITEYFRQVNSSKTILLKYSNYEKAKTDFETYKRVMDLCKKEPLPIRKYWQELQEFFAQTEPQINENIQESAAILELIFNNKKYKGKVRQQHLNNEIIIQEVIYFHRIKP